MLFRSPDVEIVLNKYDNDMERYMQEMEEQLASGAACDIMDATGITDGILSNMDPLADMYPMLRNDPGFNESEYYMNVLDGMAYYGKLAEFPTCFTYSLLGVHDSFSADLTERYRQYDRITYRELLDLYSSVPDKEGRYLSKNIDAITATNANINSFIDLNNKTCDFNNPRYIAMIADAKQATPPQKTENEELNLLFGKYMSKANQEACATEYLFDSALASDFLVYFPLNEEEVFTHYIPEAGENGALTIVPVRRFCIAESSQNKELAWEFIKFLTTPEANMNVVQPAFPIHRELFKDYVTKEVVPQVELWRSEGYDIEEDIGIVTEQVLSRLSYFNEMPMEYQRYVLSIDDLFMETLVPFYQGRFTAEEAAAELQAKVSEFLQASR